MSTLLAIDLGLRTGLSLFGNDGRLRWYRSHNFGTPARLRRHVHTLLGELPDLVRLVLEGGGPLAAIWEHEAQRKSIEIRQISAEDWRRVLLYPRQQRNGPQAKHNAADLARRVIDWSGAPRPTRLRHDAAEAILIGFWGVLDIGWLPALPDAIRH